jgi:DNA-binding transcriptional LysR family regulator
VPGHYLLPEALARFKQAHPGLEVSLTIGNSQEIRNGVREGRFELGMVGDRVRDDRVAYEQLAQDRLVVAMRPEHPLSSRGELTAADLVGPPLVMREYGSGTRAALERGLNAANISVADLNVFLELSSIEAIKMAIRSVDALAVLSEWSVRDEARLKLLHIAALDGVEVERDLFLVKRAHGFLSVASEAFLSFFRTVLKDHTA